MKRKLLVLLLAALTLFACAALFAACGEGSNVPQHSHSWSQSWEKNETHHWHNCTEENCPVTDNSQKDGYAEHDFSGGDCVCGQPKPHTHVWSQSWDKNETHHWHNCTEENCPVTDNSQKDGYAEHDYSNGNCVCGQPKPHTHVWSQSWEINDTHHWHNCTAENCTITDNSQKDGYAEHDFSGGDCVCGQPKPSDGLKYSLSADNTYYSVTGIGTCTDTDVVIPSVYNNLPVTKIAVYAFSSCRSLTSIVIPDSVTTIDDWAFSYCRALTSVTIGNGVTSIGNLAFENCSSLTSITIPDSVTSIGMGAFSYCSSLNYNEYENAYYLGNASNPYLALIEAKNTSVTNCTINSNTKFICYKAFYNCRSLTSIEIPDSVTSISDNAFGYCTSLESITIPDSVTSIGEYAFGYCTSLESITIPDSVTSIGDNAFNSCSALTSVTIGNGVTSMGDYAFSDCRALTSVTIGNGVTSIGNYAFSTCLALTSVTIGNGVTSIGRGAFQYCSALTSVTFTNTSGWWISDSSTATSGTNVDVTDISQNVTYLTSTYQSYYWKRG